MRTVDKTIQIILDTKVDSDAGVRLISNERLVGKKPHTELEEYGIDAMAGGVRRAIEDELETKHGFGLQPWDYKGVWEIVAIDRVAANRVSRRLVKIQTAIANAEMMALNYRTNPHISAELDRDLKAVSRTVDFCNDFLEEALEPKLARLQKRLEKYEEGDAA